MLDIPRPHHTSLRDAQHIYAPLAQPPYYSASDVLIGIESNIGHTRLL